VAWFTFDPVLSGGAGSGLIFSKNNATVSVEGWEHRVALGSVGFSRGVHYWEFTIDNYTADTDPAFGVARIDVARNKMLGECPTHSPFSGLLVAFAIQLKMHSRRRDRKFDRKWGKPEVGNVHNKWILALTKEPIRMRKVRN